MRREALERRQVWIYLGAALLGLLVGHQLPDTVAGAEHLLWPALALLLFATFTQIPMVRLAEGARDLRFNTVLLAGNFVVMPAVVWLLVQTLPQEPVIRLAVAAVLLVPCTDWFITFTHLARGDGARAIAASPLLLLTQLLLLPFYLTLLFDGGVMIEAGLDTTRILGVFAGLILVPLAAATLLQYRTNTASWRQPVLTHLAWLPVPLLALVVFLVTATQFQVVTHWLPAMGHATALFVGYLLAAALVGKLLARMAGLSVGPARTLTFSLGTRNSFVVLPLALALPAGWEAAVVVIVLQTLVELLGMIAWLRWIPAWLLPDGPRVK
jgi:arsenite transporter